MLSGRSDRRARTRFVGNVQEGSGPKMEIALEMETGLVKEEEYSRLPHNTYPI